MSITKKIINKALLFFGVCSLALGISTQNFNKTEKASAEVGVNSGYVYAADEDVTVDYNYTLHKGLYPAKNRDIGFSGKNYIDASGNLTAGHYFSTQVDGAEISLGENFGEVLGYGKNNESVNKFSVTGMRVPNVRADIDPSNGSYAEAQKYVSSSFRALEFIITDNANENNVIKVLLKGGSEANGDYGGNALIQVSATYNGVSLSTTTGEQAISIHSATFRNRFYAYSGSPFNFEFSKNDKKINIYAFKSVKTGETYLDGYTSSFENFSGGSLDIAGLQGFDSYSVDMKLSDFVDVANGTQGNNYNQKRSANVLLFEMAGQVLYPTRTTWNDTAGPIVTQQLKEVVALKEYDTSEILSMYDMTCGAIDEIGTTNGKYTVKIDGVNCANGKYTFTAPKQEGPLR